MKKKVMILVTVTALAVGGALYGFSSKTENCPLAGTPECPLVKDCPLAGTPECPLIKDCSMAGTPECPMVKDCCKKK